MAPTLPVYFQGTPISLLNPDGHDQNGKSDLTVSKFTKAIGFKYDLTRAEVGRLFLKRAK